MSVDHTGLSVRVVENALKILVPSMSDRVEGAAGLVDSLRQFRTGRRTKSVIAARLHEAAEAIAERMQRLRENEFRAVGENERTAAIEGVLEAIDDGRREDQIPLEDLTAEHLVSRYQPSAERAWEKRLLSEDGRNYGRIYLSHSCDYIVALAKGMPDFDSRVVWETYVLGRRLEEALASSIAGVVPPVVTAADNHELESMEASHRSNIANSYKDIDLFGLSLPTDMRRQPIEISYIHLRASYPKGMHGESLSRHVADVRRDDEERDDFPVEPRQTVVGRRMPSSAMVDVALADTFNHGQSRSGATTFSFHDDKSGERFERYLRHGARVMLVGGAGSGKTTISRWLAVRVATRRLPKDLRSALDQCVPFYVPLRGLLREKSTPSIDDLFFRQDPALRSIGRRWLLSNLRDGKALIILDGFDELSETARSAAEIWLKELLAEYPACHYFATSRPEGLRRQWFAHYDFELVELFPMALPQARECISNWYAALKDGATVEKHHQYDRQLHKLLGDLETRPAVTDLAQTPLLCAMLSALYATNTPESAPQTRMDLYARVVESLVDRRDRERLLLYEGMTDFSAREKLQLLQAIARYMTEESRQLVPIWRSGLRPGNHMTAIAAVEERLVSMPTAAVTPTEALEHLVDRSVVFSDVGGGEGQFAHRTFQEFLAGRDYAYVGDVNNLLSNAHDPAYRNTIVFAAGAASQSVASQIVRGLISSAKASDNRRDMLLLIAECVGASGPLSQDTADAAREMVRMVMPPRTLDEADTLAGFGDHVIAWLGGLEITDVPTLRASMHAAVKVGTPRAMSILGTYASLPLADEITEELIDAWPRFPAAAYATQVIVKLDLSQRVLSVTSTESLRALGAAPNIRNLRLNVSVDDLHALSGNRQLLSLGAVGSLGGSIDGIGQLTALRKLDLRHNRLIQDIAAVGTLTALRELYLDGCTSLVDLDALGGLVGLRVISAKFLTEVRDWSWLASLTNAWTVAVDGSSLTTLDVVGSMESLRSLFVDVPIGLRDLSVLSRCPQLRRLRVRLDPAADKDVDFPPTLHSLELVGRADETVLSRVAALPELRRLKLTQMSKLSDLRILESMTELTELTIHDAGTVADWSGLAQLTRVRRLDLSGCAVTDTSFAEHMTGLETAIFDRCRILQHLGGLARSTVLERVSLNECSGAMLGSEVNQLREESRSRRTLKIDYDPFAFHDFSVS
ncbi:NACHT domain-containing protein [Micromonospora sp. NPDC047074]|uniref:NACHT domain-containing protein n=1 Tax=Micromonospora sp. NPDC047074 TaxID=3154339 RepID=UPI0033DC10A4